MSDYSYGEHIKVIEWAKVSNGARAVLLRPDKTTFVRWRFPGCRDFDRELGTYDDYKRRYCNE